MTSTRTQLQWLYSMVVSVNSLPVHCATDHCAECPRYFESRSRYAGVEAASAVLRPPHDLRPGPGMHYPRLRNPGAANLLRFTHELENAMKSESIVHVGFCYTGSHDDGGNSDRVNRTKITKCAQLFVVFIITTRNPSAPNLYEYRAS